MYSIGKLILAVIAGAAVWAVLWGAGTQATLALLPDIVQEGVAITSIGVLLGYIVYSAVLSCLAGYVTAIVAKSDTMKAVWTLATLQLGLGIYFELSYWDLMPSWYHIVFLVLIVPATVYGGLKRVAGTARESNE